LDAAQSNFLNTFNGLINGLSSGNIGSSAQAILQRLSANETAADASGFTQVSWSQSVQDWWNGTPTNTLTAYRNQLTTLTNQLRQYRNDPVLGQIYQNTMIEIAALNQIEHRLDIMRGTPALMAERENPASYEVAAASPAPEGGHTPTPIRIPPTSGTPSVIQTA
jgi:hypothetical protein